MGEPRKKILRGWVGKQEFADCISDWFLDGRDLPYLYNLRYEEKDWTQSQWPPIKVTVTIEWED